MHADLESIVCKFGDDPAICLREEAICANVYRRTDGRRTPRDCISSWNELKTETSKLDSRVFCIFLPNVIKIDPYNFELYRFKVGAFFETQCTKQNYKTIFNE